MLEDEAILSGPSTPLGMGVVLPGEAGLLRFGPFPLPLPLICWLSSRSNSRPLPLPLPGVGGVAALEK